MIKLVTGYFHYCASQAARRQFPTILGDRRSFIEPSHRFIEERTGVGEERLRFWMKWSCEFAATSQSQYPPVSSSHEMTSASSRELALSQRRVKRCEWSQPDFPTELSTKSNKECNCVSGSGNALWAERRWSAFHARFFSRSSGCIACYPGSAPRFFDLNRSATGLKYAIPSMTPSSKITVLSTEYDIGDCMVVPCTGLKKKFRM